MDDLVEWLRAQLDEDERTARAATPGPWRAGVRSGFDAVDGDGWTVCNASDVDVAHIARHDPARVLREIDAKRRTLIRCEEAMLSASPMLVHFAKQTAWEMALPYADRPGYRDDWRP
ncbi:DUF6221 family protein [Streptomyces sp. NPDC006967]|uniref:DUF6221 family protein n=1 Tax=Streptomyces sp. NPDC006967 TaxID=3156906 RepID=UPI0033CAF104